jgi:hypothetical protein
MNRRTRRSIKPFFLAIGLVKPHMPFSVPRNGSICFLWIRLNYRRIVKTA